MSLTQVQNGMLVPITGNNISANTITGSNISSNTITSTNLQTNSVENYMNTQGFSMGMRNRFINGNFSIAQRSSTSTSTPSAGVTSYISLDRWFISQTGTTALLTSGQTTAQTVGVNKAGYFGRSSGQTNVPAGIFFGQQIESVNVFDLRNQSITISFNAFRGSDAPSNLNCVIRFGTGVDESSSNGLGGSWTGYSSSPASVLTVSTTVSSFTKTVVVPSNASEMMILFYYYPTGTAGANEYFALENIQLEKGSVATPFEFRPYGTELALCQRYYYPLPNETYGFPSPSSGGYAMVQKYPFPVTMRSAPTMFWNYSSSYNLSTINSYSSTSTGVNVQYVASAAGNAGWTLSGSYASAEL